MIDKQKQIVLYTLYIILVSLIIKLIPNSKLSNLDVVLISIITIMICLCYSKSIIIDTFIKSTPNKNSKKTKTKVKTSKPPKTKVDTSKSTITKVDTSKPTIIFPYSLEYLIKIFNDVKNNTLDKNSIKTKEFEILVKIFQTNIEISQKYLIEQNYNKLNDLIMNIKLKEQKNQSTELLPSQNKFLKTMMTQNKYINENGFINNIIESDMRYTMYSPEQNMKLGTNSDNLNNQWKNDYVILNTDRWAPPINHKMYKCKVENPCPVCPSLTTGYPVKLKEFDASRKILPPDNINVNYINEKLLSGLS